MVAAVFYNVYQAARQPQAAYVLLHMLLALAYAGLALLYFSADIFAFILWIVYGSFVAVVFVLTFMWGDAAQFTFSDAAAARLRWLPWGAAAAAAVGVGLSQPSADYYWAIFELG